MKYDYTKAFKLINKIPNLNNTFVALPTTRSAVKLNSERFAFAAFFISGTLIFFGLFNIDHRMNSYDISHNFRIMPDYITGTRLNSFRKERKHFNLY